jgi:hypothetical protein
MAAQPRSSRSLPFAVGIGLAVFGAYLLLMGVRVGAAPLVLGGLGAAATFRHHRLGLARPRPAGPLPFAIGVGLTVFGVSLLLTGVSQGWAPLMIGAFAAITTLVQQRVGI